MFLPLDSASGYASNQIPFPFDSGKFFQYFLSKRLSKLSGIVHLVLNLFGVFNGTNDIGG